MLSSARDPFTLVTGTLWVWGFQGKHIASLNAQTSCSEVEIVLSTLVIRAIRHMAVVTVRGLICKYSTYYCCRNTCNVNIPWYTLGMLINDSLDHSLFVNLMMELNISKWRVIPCQINQEFRVGFWRNLVCL